jgi:hypothetical protein
MAERNRDVSGQAYDINGILRTSILACDPLCEFVEWNGDNGIERSLRIAERMLMQLIEDIEGLEREVENAQA